MATVAARQPGVETSESSVGVTGSVSAFPARRLWAARRSGSLIGAAVLGASLALVVLPPVLMVAGIAAGWVGAPLAVCIVAIKDVALALSLTRLWSGPLDPLRERVGHAIDVSCAALSVEPARRGAGHVPSPR